MKPFFALATAAFIGATTIGTAEAQSDNRHMFEFNVDSVLQGLLSFDKSKTKGTKADNDTQMNLSLNYARAMERWPSLQLGGRLNYLKDTVGGRGDAEDYGFQVGAIYNFSGIGNPSADLTNSAYVSLYLGLEWANTYGSATGRKDELLKSTLSLGKRFDLKRWGINHLVYSPEVSLQNENSTTGSGLEYSQNVQLRFLQFSVFF